MDDEMILTGYCRCLDQSRIVTAERNGAVWEADCSYGSCPYEASCDIAKKLAQSDN